MTIEFTLSIDMGNDAMQYADDIAATLKRVADKINSGDFHPGHTKSILDDNGNRVGSWKFSA